MKVESRIIRKVEGVESITVKSVLNPTKGFISSFDYSINPYMGCLFNCSYCYVPYGFEQSYGTWGRDYWGRWLKVKTNAPQLLEKELRKLYIKGKLDNTFIYLGSVTDPYVLPVERKIQLTRKLLRIFLKYPVGFINIQTRSPLVVRDLDILKELNNRTHHGIAVCITIPTNRPDIKKIFERRSPGLMHRLKALEKVYKSGIETQASVAPLLPCEPSTFAQSLDKVCSRAVLDPLIEIEKKRRNIAVFEFKKPTVAARTRQSIYSIIHRHNLGDFFTEKYLKC